MLAIWRQVTGTLIPIDSEWDWIDPGIISVIAGAAMLSGVTRLAIAVTVMMVRYVNVSLVTRGFPYLLILT